MPSTNKVADKIMSSVGSDMLTSPMWVFFYSPLTDHEWLHPLCGYLFIFLCQIRYADIPFVGISLYSSVRSGMLTSPMWVCISLYSSVRSDMLTSPMWVSFYIPLSDQICWHQLCGYLFIFLCQIRYAYILFVGIFLHSITAQWGWNIAVDQIQLSGRTDIPSRSPRRD